MVRAKGAVSKMLEPARAAASVGLRLIPLHGVYSSAGVFECTCGTKCKSPGKHPLVKDWVTAATSDDKSIAAWWTKWPWANIGIVTGAASGIVVLDVDASDGGIESLRQIEEQHGSLPQTPRVSTGNGFHMYFRHPGGIVRNSAGLLGPGLDVRGDGGYVVGAGSMHVSGRKYEWHGGVPLRADFAEMPQWLRRALVRCATEVTVDMSSPVNEGRRNVFLTSLAGAMRRYGCSRETIAVALKGANRDRCMPPLDDEEVEAIAKSVSRYKPGEVRMLDG